MGIRATKIRVAVEKAKLDQRAKEDDLLKFFKEHSGVLHKVELYASTDISKHLEEFLKKYLNRL